MAKSETSASGMLAEEKDWRAESDLRALIDAEKIKADPARLKAAMAKKRDLAKALKSIEG